MAEKIVIALGGNALQSGKGEATAEAQLNVVKKTCEHLADISEKGYEIGDSLLDPEQNDGLAPWEKVTAAIGYAVFDSDKDETPSGTFRRADREMYLQKQKTKTKHS